MIDKILKDIKGLFKVQDKVKFLKQNIPCLAFFYIGNIFSHHVRAYIGGDIIDKIFQGILEINTMSFLPSLHPTDIIMGVVVAVLIKIIVYTKGKNAKKFRRGKEYGSARCPNAYGYFSLYLKHYMPIFVEFFLIVVCCAECQTDFSGMD